jgi:hypothetical protein
MNVLSLLRLYLYTSLHLPGPLIWPYHRVRTAALKMSQQKGDADATPDFMLSFTV